MTQIEAIFRDGVFKPLTPIQLDENERVLLSVRSFREDPMVEWAAEADRVREKIRCAHGVLPDSTPDIAEDRMR